MIYKKVTSALFEKHELVTTPRAVKSEGLNSSKNEVNQRSTCGFLEPIGETGQHSCSVQLKKKCSKLKNYLKYMEHYYLKQPQKSAINSEDATKVNLHICRQLMKKMNDLGL